MPTNSTQSIYNYMQTTILMQNGSFNIDHRKTLYKTDMVMTALDPIFMLFETKGVNANGQSLKMVFQFNFEIC